MSQTVLFTFHKIRDKGEQGDAAAWRAFMEFYSPALLRLLEIHAAVPTKEGIEILKKTLAGLTAGNFAQFRAAARESEREFLGDIRAHVLETANRMAGSDAAKQASDHKLGTEQVTGLLEGIPLLHKEMLFFKLAGYTDATLEDVMRLSPRVAAKAFERLSPEYEATLKGDQDRCPWPGAWLSFLSHARSLKTETCISPHQFMRIHDGQVSWYDKEPVEKHVSGCLHCLEAWAGLREMGYWRRAAEEVSIGQMNDLLSAVPIQKPAEKKSFFQRLRS